jgi:3-dehydroquinate synthase
MTKADSYPTVIDGKISPKLNTFLRAGKYSSYFIICDSNTLQYCLPVLLRTCKILSKAEIIELEPGEANKELPIVAGIWQTLTQYGADKKSLVINLGGGTVSDTGGFAASTFKRGIDYINVPTTLLAMVDASVGGKTGINFENIKNHIGTITQPKGVFINAAFLNTLPFAQIASGYAEVIKTALIADKKLFQQIRDLNIGASFPVKSIIQKSVQLKNAIIKKDPEEKGLRKILNFGHSAGHAIESLYMNRTAPMFHGEAVAIGMAIESHISLLRKKLTQKEFSDIVNCLSLNFRLPLLEEKDEEKFFAFLKQDKKNQGKDFHFALLHHIGKCEPSVKISEAQVKKSLQYYNQFLANAPALQ